MKTIHGLVLLMPFLLLACGQGSSPQVPLAELPDPAIYALDLSELPDVGLSWNQTYNQTSTEDGFKWSYLAYQAYQPGNLGMELESGFAINNDVVLYEVDMSREVLPDPPSEMGGIKDITWKPAPQSSRVGDKSAVWKTTLGEMFTPVWWLEFYQDHAYVRLSLLGFPDQIAPSILYGMADIISSRLPRSVEQLRADAATSIPVQTFLPPASTPEPSTSQPDTDSTLTSTAPPGMNQVAPLSYTAPPGETGMLAFTDETGTQLTDGTSGSDDILADLGSGSAYEWVGWTEETEPVTITFTFEGKPDFAAVKIGINHRDGLAIFVPESVTINGERYELAPDAVPNNYRADLSFEGPFSGDKIELVLTHRGRGWILVDEVRFYLEP